LTAERVFAILVVEHLDICQNIDELGVPALKRRRAARQRTCGQPQRGKKGVSNPQSVFKALADPTRRAILRLLRERDMTAGEIAAHFPVTRASISHHLALLKQANLVVDERRGQHIVYSLNTTVFQEVLAWLMELARPE